MIAIILVSAQDDGERLGEMFPESYTAKGYYLSKTKVKYVIQYKLQFISRMFLKTILWTFNLLSSSMKQHLLSGLMNMYIYDLRK